MSLSSDPNLIHITSEEAFDALPKAFASFTRVIVTGHLKSITHPLEGAWLCLAEGAHVKTVSGDARIDYMGETAGIDLVTEDARVGTVTDDACIKMLAGNARIDLYTSRAPLTAMGTNHITVTRDIDHSRLHLSKETTLRVIDIGPPISS
jgi:hypothetical protein